MRSRGWDDFVQFDQHGRFIHRANDRPADLDSDSAAPTGAIDDEVNFTVIPVGTTLGASDFTGDTDIFRVNLTAGTTYLFSLKGAGANPLNDTFLELFSPAGAGIKNDDDGG